MDYSLDLEGGISVKQNKSLRFSCKEIYDMMGRHKGPVAHSHEQLVANGYVDVAHITDINKSDPLVINRMFDISGCDKIAEQLAYTADVKGTTYETNETQNVQTVYVKLTSLVPTAHEPSPNPL